MIKENIVIIPLIHEWNWTADFQKQTGNVLKKYDNFVVAYELHKKDVNLKRLLFKRKGPLIRKFRGIYFVTPFHLIPYQRLTPIYYLNRKIAVFLLLLWVKVKFGFCKKIVFWFFHPREVWILSLLRKFFPRSFTFVYDYLDFFAGGSVHEKKRLLQKERELLSKADVVTAISKTFLHYIRKTRKNANLVPQGFKLHDFQNPVRSKTKFGSNKPILGYVGGVNNRINYDLCIKLATNNPNWQFVFWGPVQNQLFNDKKIENQIKHLLSLKNVQHGESRNPREIPSIIAQFDICTIPYDISLLFNKYSYPMKLFEYFFTGKPIMSTPIEEFKYFPKLIITASTQNDWEREIKKILNKKWPNKYKDIQKNLALQNTWERKIEAISNLIEKV